MCIERGVIVDLATNARAGLDSDCSSTELRDKERVRRTFGFHVGRKVAEQILTRFPGVGGAEHDVTAMFADIRAFTASSANREPRQVVALLNRFLDAMVQVVEPEHNGR